MLMAMSDVTRILSQIEQGDPQAAEKLLPLVYQELRKLAAAKLAHEKPGQTLQATALVHDAYVRLVDLDQAQRWDSRGHFFSAAAEAMRRVLVENARRKQRCRHGGDFERHELHDELPCAEPADPSVVLMIDESLSQLQAEDPPAASVVKLHFFAGLTLDETADALHLSRTTTYRHWAYARAWLKTRLPQKGLDG
jgi:RNA polymerase sigma factor (TIGR02999 family)